MAIENVRDTVIKPRIDSRPYLVRYYDLLESRIGYKLLLGGTRHFGYYDSPDDRPWPIKPALQRMEDRLYEGLELPDGGKVLDCGCGSGYVAKFMAQHGLRVEAFDFMPRHVARAKKVMADAGLSNAVTVRQADYHNLQFFDSNSFDGLYTCETLVHATDPVKALQGFHRILKPGGSLALLEYAHSDWQDSKHPHRIRLKERLDVINTWSDMPSFVGEGEMPRWVKDAGFESIQVMELTKHVLPMMRLFWMLAILPYFLVQFLGLEARFPNVVAGVEMYRGRNDWHYYRIMAKKPLGNGSDALRARVRKRVDVV